MVRIVLRRRTTTKRPKTTEMGKLTFILTFSAIHRKSDTDMGILTENNENITDLFLCL